MNKNLLIILAIFLLIVSVLFNQSTTYLFKAHRSVQPQCTSNFYQKAGMLWPPLYFNSEFKKITSELRDFKHVYEYSSDIIAYFKLDASKQDIRLLIKELEATLGISSVLYVRRDEALEIYKKLHKDDPLLLENIVSEAVPESLEIKLDRSSSAQSIGEILENSPLVEEVQFRDNYKGDCSDL